MAVLQNLPFSACGRVSPVVVVDEREMLNLEVELTPARIARELGEDVQIRDVFAHLPRYRHGELVWENHELFFAGKRATSNGVVDVYSRSVEVDARAQRDNGVAFGMITDHGVLWLQDFDQNFR